MLEPLGGYLTLCEHLIEQGPRGAESWNFGPEAEAEKPVRYLADRIATMWADGTRWRNVSEVNAPHEAKYLKLNVSKARDQLGWTPKLTLDQALALTVNWYKAYGAGREMRQYSFDQIADYFAVARQA